MNTERELMELAQDAELTIVDVRMEDKFVYMGCIAGYIQKVSHGVKWEC